MERLPSKACILASLSRALDMVEGQPEGHAIRSARIALRIGELLGMNQQQLENLFFAGVLKDSGCSNNSVRIHKIFGGDEFLSKRAVKFVDWTNPIESVKFALKNTEIGQPLSVKLRRMASNLGPPGRIMNEVTEARCTRGAAIAKLLSFDDEVASAIQNLDEHWDGKGSPVGLAGLDIPLHARILCLCQTVEVFVTTYGLGAACEMAEARSGKWFEPELVQIFLKLKSETEFWADLQDVSNDSFIEEHLPGLKFSAVGADIDAICEAFAMIVDAKSSFTAEHSTRVTDYAVTLAKWFQFAEADVTTIRRASLLHDIGKLGVSTGILEKPSKLDDQEFDRVKLHPKFSYEILGRIPTFEKIADIASAHHERLDGRGYWRGLTAEQLPLDVRIVTVCDVFDALTARRPYRDAMSPDDALVIMEKDTGTAFDPDCIEAVRECFVGSMSLAA